ncbi:MAG: hypothetical protein J0M18_15515 [Ignavibacteria bacterium]|jgi:hypothetical protein|nr:hypothetical protein [Ignavibacteria bacterium]
MENKLDNIVENSLRESLLKKPHSDFAKNLMLKISLEEEFAKQDKKTEKFAVKIILSISAFFIGTIVMIAYYLFKNPEYTANADSLTEKTNSWLEVYSFKLFNIFGLTGTSSVILALSIVIIATLFLTADRFILKKK